MSELSYVWNAQLKNKRGKKMRTKLYCESCNEFRDYEVKKELRKYKIRGIDVEAKINISYCKSCGEELFNPKLESANDVILFDEYKVKTDLMTSSQIKNIRDKYHITQVAFAKVLGLGEKTITRYENGTIQDESINNLLMLSEKETNFMELWNKNKAKLTKKENEKINEFFTMYIEEHTKYIDESYEGRRKEVRYETVDNQGGSIDVWESKI